MKEKYASVKAPKKKEPENLENEGWAKSAVLNPEVTHHKSTVVSGTCSYHGVEHPKGTKCKRELKNELKKDNPDFYLEKCKKCPYFDDIKSFNYGGVSSRFSVLRKHINSV